ncbi:MarR family transcriptional regulator [Crossiella sp. CA-258035]|uniref:MarR family winged helix-turn-helix transcriptional regulator n=1 Tax=Crossiella sp. CA-258035 TaxID=2981138 RepID=UPI0024BC2487|nr:MarR family transcriptional regulator [Crossiella sp. CA-258035]WHT23420.1 MarR family transcriptional regulator [Crossiella sp. CA-258035]
MRAWRTYIVGSQLLAYQLNRELQDEHGLTLADYEILVRLSEQPEQRMRMSQLAGEVASSKSRLSHQITRMERAGLVTRVDCPSDGRGVFAQLTESGITRLKTAAPAHLDGVRSHLVDLLTPAEHTALATIFAKVQDHLAGR